MSALDTLLDARVTHHEISLWLGISEQAIRLRAISREKSALNQLRQPSGAESKSHNFRLASGKPRLLTLAPATAKPFEAICSESMP